MTGPPQAGRSEGARATPGAWRKGRAAAAVATAAKCTGSVAAAADQASDAGSDAYMAEHEEGDQESPLALARQRWAQCKKAMAALQRFAPPGLFQAVRDHAMKAKEELGALHPAAESVRTLQDREKARSALVAELSDKQQAAEAALSSPNDRPALARTCLQDTRQESARARLAAVDEAEEDSGPPHVADISDQGKALVTEVVDWQSTANV